MDNDFTDGLGIAIAAVVSFLVIGVIVLVGWQAGWWFQVQNAKRQGQIINIEGHNIRNGYSNQQTLRDEITANEQNVSQATGELPFVTKDQRGGIELQRKYEVNTICADAAQVTGDPLDSPQASFVNQNCSDGSIKTTSQYWVP